MPEISRGSEQQEGAGQTSFVQAVLRIFCSNSGKELSREHYHE